MPVTKYIYDFDAVLQETDGAGVALAAYTRTGPGYGDLLSRHDGSNSRYYEPDALGSTDALANDAQVVTDRWAYRAYGAATQTTGSDPTPFNWVGRQSYFSDSQTGHYLLGSGTRHYDPNTVQFLSQDPIGFADGDANTRRYARNNPVNLIDPSGKTASTGSCGIAIWIGIEMGVSWYIRFCKETCDMAQKDPNLSHSGGGIICRDGIRCACLFEVDLGDFVRRFPGACLTLDRCSMMHEVQHFGDVLPCPKKGLVRPKWRVSEAEQIKRECQLRREQIGCIEKALVDLKKSTLNDDKDCVLVGEAQIKSFEKWMKEKCPEEKK